MGQKFLVNNSFGDHFRKNRMRQGLTQAIVALAADISEMELNEIELGFLEADPVLMYSLLSVLEKKKNFAFSSN